MEDPIMATQIMFAQTREDARVEIDALESVSKYNSGLRVCLVASAGDTICNIACSDIAIEIQEIDAIDLNEYQLNLSQLKYGALSLDTNSRYNFLSCDPKNEKINRKTIIDNLMYQAEIDKELHAFWTREDNIKMIDSGINQAGRFEILFARLMQKMNFDKWFDHLYLTKIFGVNATKYSMNRSFSDHFKNVYEQYKKNYTYPDDNYFYYQFVKNMYKRDGDLPIYLQRHTVSKIPVKFIKNNMLKHLENCPDAYYDLVSLSNITDWIDPVLLENIFDTLGRVLKPNGKAVLRRLNSDIPLAKYLEEKYTSNGKYKFYVSQNIFDKSYFYSEVVVITKK